MFEMNLIKRLKKGWNLSNSVRIHFGFLKKHSSSSKSETSERKISIVSFSDKIDVILIPNIDELDRSQLWWTNEELDESEEMVDARDDSSIRNDSPTREDPLIRDDLTLGYNALESRSHLGGLHDLLHAQEIRSIATWFNPRRHSDKM
mmetsp:Transcript_17218/g.25515  ORF Transcript_17218/g.25515 Transcript_17218/m.25515 type:complete len:148 (+) Transcript_17218:49-492(+)|eukprot:CAMPEP_0171456976 /NCGR_PEP_ID=MMETSP0945-20130129/3245_1 /TAXON_ID=109269 /ORGANISM="Vaucheria litorea, Strain CCMP2940" /LENGTH=147 /DNA_ID=CAMNT_0011982503 /DNA_START=20 /DNA_END=463 /DNA_ORIENTATION=-